MEKAKLIFFLFLFYSVNLFSQSVFEQKFKLAQSFEKGGDFSKAEEIYFELYQKNKKNLDYFNGLVRCKKAQNKFSEILPLIDEQFSFRKTFDLFLLAGEINWLTGNYEQAKSFWQRAISTNPRSDSTYLKVAEIQSNLRQFNYAVETLLNGRKNLESKILFNNELINLYLIIGDLENCIDEIFLGFDSNKDINWAQAKISLLIENKKFKEIFEKKIQRKEPDINYKSIYAWFLYSIKEFDKALNVNKELDESTKAGGAIVYRFAQTAISDGEYDIALKAFEHIVSMGKKSPYLSSAILGIAKATDFKISQRKLVDKELIKKVINQYEHALENFSPNSAPFLETNYRIAQLSSHYLGDFSKAEIILRALLKNQYYPIVLKSKLLLGDIYLFEYKFKDALNIYRDIQNTTKNSKPYEYFLSLMRIGKVFYYQSAFDSAQYYFSLLLEDSPSEITSEALRKSLIIEKYKQYNLAFSLYVQSELMKEKSYCDSTIILLEQAKTKAEGTEFEEFINLQIIKEQVENENYANAEKLCLDFQKKFPSSIYFEEVIYNLGFSLYKQKKQIEAINTFTELLTKFPHSIYTTKARNLINKIRNKES